MEVSWGYTVIILDSFCLVGLDFFVFVLVGGLFVYFGFGFC